MWSEDAQRQLGASDEDSEEGSEEEESEEESDDGAGPSTQTQTAAELSREARKAEKKARKEAAIARAKKPVQVGDLPPSDSEEEEDDDMPANPNHSRKARSQTKQSAVDEAAEGVEKLSVAPSRREREAMEAQAAKERYRKLHEAGKTDEAKADLARLKLIREKREAEAARKQVCHPVIPFLITSSMLLTTGRLRGRRRRRKTRPGGPRSRPGRPSGARQPLAPRRSGRRNEACLFPRIAHPNIILRFFPSILVISVLDSAGP
jgi:hypothetical protein